MTPLPIDSVVLDVIHALKRDGRALIQVASDAAQAVDMYTNTAFRVKMLLVLLAGVNVALIEWTIKRNEAGWGERRKSPGLVKFSAVVSILLWLGIVAMSRVIGFTGARE